MAAAANIVATVSGVLPPCGLEPSWTLTGPGRRWGRQSRAYAGWWPESRPISPSATLRNERTDQFTQERQAFQSNRVTQVLLDAWSLVLSRPTFPSTFEPVADFIDASHQGSW